MGIHALRVAAAAALFGLSAIVSTGQAQDERAERPLNIEPETVQEKRNLVKVPDGFEFDLFAAPPEVNYPAAITATPEGDLFVAVDKNASLDREFGRGSILKVMDTDRDGRGDRYTVFVDSVDSPRGLVYDGSKLYVMHPPTLSVFEDTDGDGQADRSRKLVEDLGFGLDFRGADHTTNGMEMGIDGWLYIAVGDYGFLEAVGSDGRTISHRGGGIVRVRPDGSELEIHATGLRNPYDVTLDPFLNGFERGNTNDGYGWRIRLQHIVPQAEFGYPDLFKNFSEEVKPPLADYGGGSGAGALYVDAPHLMPDSVGQALYTVDWGRSAVFRHELSPAGASFEPTQSTFFQVPQPTDMTVDGRGNLFVSSWLGASFSYAGEDVGFVARLTHESTPEVEIPNFSEAPTGELVELLGHPHALVRLHAQREILRREPGRAVRADIADLARGNPAREDVEEVPLDVRVAAIFTLKQLQGAGSHEVLVELTDDPAVREFALRALADRIPQNEHVSHAPFLDALDDPDPRVRLHALNGLTRLDAREAAARMLPLTADADRTVAHVAVRSLIELEAVEPALAAVRSGSPALIDGGVQVLQRLRDEEALTGLIEIFEQAIDPYRQRQTLEALARLYHREADWHGTLEEWWGTTPSPRGPYYAPVEWSGSDRLEPVLASALEESEGVEYRRRVEVLELNRAVPEAAGALLAAAERVSDSLKTRVIDLTVGAASVTEGMIPGLEELAGHSPAFQRGVTDLLTAQTELPAASASLLRGSVLDETMTGVVRARALEAMLELPYEGRLEDWITVQSELIERSELPGPLADAIGEFAEMDAHAAHAERFTELTESPSSGRRRLGFAVLLELAADDELENGPRTAVEAALENGWNAADPTASLLWAIGLTRTEGYEDRIRDHLENDSSELVRQAARYAARRLEL